MNIPILNIYYLLLYAWDALDEAESLQVQAEDCTQLVDLFARVLDSGTEHVVRRGLDRGYVTCRDTLPGIRGRIDLAASLRTASLRKARAVCEFDEFNHDVLHNRIIKSTIRRLLAVPDLSEELRDRLSKTSYRLHQISEIDLSERAFRAVQLHRNNRHYALLMDVCRLIHRAHLTTEEAGEKEFRDFMREERRMRRMFERFVRNFYRREQSSFHVTANRLRWAGTAGAPADLALLPEMRTDIHLKSRTRRIIVETKFVPHLFQEYYGRATFRSAHLYQLATYLQNVSATEKRGRSVEGILLYPAGENLLDAQLRVLGYPLRVVTLNLRQVWQGIHRDLLALIEPPAQSGDMP